MVSGAFLYRMHFLAMFWTIVILIANAFVSSTTDAPINRPDRVGTSLPTMGPAPTVTP